MLIKRFLIPSFSSLLLLPLHSAKPSRCFYSSPAATFLHKAARFLSYLPADTVNDSAVTHQRQPVPLTGRPENDRHTLHKLLCKNDSYFPERHEAIIARVCDAIRTICISQATL